MATSYTQFKTLVIGSSRKSDNDSVGHQETEWFDAASGTWSDVMDYPFSQALFDYSIVSIGKKFFVFGGATDASDPAGSTVDLVAQFFINVNDDPWKRLGSLQAARYGHGAIFKQDLNGVNNFWIIG